MPWGMSVQDQGFAVSSWKNSSGNGREQGATVGPAEVSPEPPIRVLVVEKSQVVGLGLTAILSKIPAVEVLSPVTSLSAAKQSAANGPIHVILLGLPAAGQEAARCIDELVQGLPATRIIAVSDNLSPTAMRAAFKAGALGYTVKDEQPEQFEAMIRTVYAGKRYLAPAASQVLLSSFDREPASASLAVLSPRELQVLELIALGRSSPRIALELGIRETTVHSHRASVMKKLGARNAVQLSNVWRSAQDQI